MLSIARQIQSHTRGFQNGVGTTLMSPSVLLIVSLLSLYLLGALILWNCHRGQKTETILITEVPFALQEGQTILGVIDNTEIIYFCIGEIGKHVHDEEDTVE
jgi:hypothetical protein